MQRSGAWTATWSPISLATIAAVLEQDGHQCRLDDCIIEKLSAEALMTRAQDFNADLFVLNTATPSIESDLELADALKAKFPGSHVTAIGIHVTALPDECLKTAPGLDSVIRGEPELSVQELAEKLAAGNPVTNIAGVSARAGGEIVHGPDRTPANLDELPLPAWHLVRTNLYKMPFTDLPFLLVGTSRGCPFNCEFCADPTYYGHALRTKSPGRIVEEIRTNRDKYGISDFLFWSESFTLKREWTMEVLREIIKADLDVRFVVNSRADHVDPELLKLLKQAGCWMIGFGLESGSERVLGLMNKKISVEQNRQAVMESKKAGLQVTAHMVIGYPGETEQEIRQTIDFACSLPLDFAQFYCAVPFPGSRLYETAKQKGWLKDQPWEKYEQNFSIISTPELSAERVMELRRLAYRKFYASPSRAWRVFRDQVGIKGAPRFARMLLEFREWI